MILTQVVCKARHSFLDHELKLNACASINKQLLYDKVGNWMMAQFDQSVAEIGHKDLVVQ